MPNSMTTTPLYYEGINRNHGKGSNGGNTLLLDLMTRVGMCYMVNLDILFLQK